MYNVPCKKKSAHEKTSVPNILSCQGMRHTEPTTGMEAKGKTSLSSQIKVLPDLLRIKQCFYIHSTYSTYINRAYFAPASPCMIFDTLIHCVMRMGFLLVSSCWHKSSCVPGSSELFILLNISDGS